MSDWKTQDLASSSLLLAAAVVAESAFLSAACARVRGVSAAGLLERKRTHAHVGGVSMRGYFVRFACRNVVGRATLFLRMDMPSKAQLFPASSWRRGDGDGGRGGGG